MWSHNYSDGFLSLKGHHSVQQESATTIILSKGFGHETGLWKYSWNRSWEIPGQLGKLICCNQGKRFKGVPFINNERKATAPPLVYRKFEKILSINNSCLITFATQTATSRMIARKGKTKWQFPFGIAYVAQAINPNGTKPEMAKGQVVWSQDYLCQTIW